jgi:Peptidase family S41/N-terminal domain of Peptidase_S41 in eukaryotic IRBP
VRPLAFLTALGLLMLAESTMGQSTGGATAPPPSSGTGLDATGRQRILDAVVANLEQHYFDPAVAHQVIDALVTHQRRGDDASATTGKDFATLLTAQMREVSHDLHMSVMYSETPEPQSSPQEFAHKLASLKEDNCSFKKVEILPHNIGYLKLNAFLSPTDCGSTATAAMASLNGVNALIFDLRDNIGGTSEMVSLIASSLFDHPEYMFDPRRVPTPQSWTSSPVAGSRLTNKPVYILTSSTTISGAEQFTYDLKMLKRATIVGEVTAGGAHAGVWHPIDDHYGVFIPENRAVNPYGQADWEAVGIQPDVKVPAAVALETALQLAQSHVRRDRNSPQHN